MLLAFSLNATKGPSCCQKLTQALSLGYFKAKEASPKIKPDAPVVKYFDIVGQYQVEVPTWKLANQWTAHDLLMYPRLWTLAGTQSFTLTMNANHDVYLYQPSLGLSCTGLAEIKDYIVKADLNCQGAMPKITIKAILANIWSFDEFSTEIYSTVYAEQFPGRWVEAHFKKIK